jgi:hypothetical protein
VRRTRWRSVGSLTSRSKSAALDVRPRRLRRAGLGAESLSLEEDLVAQAVAPCKDEEEARTSRWDNEEEKYVDEEEAEELGLDRPELVEEKNQSSRVLDPGVV